LQVAGIISQYEGLSHGRGPSRYEIAVSCHAALFYAASLSESGWASPKFAEPPISSQEMKKFMQAWAQHFGTYQAVLEELSYELTTMGVDMIRFRQRRTALRESLILRGYTPSQVPVLRPFSDLPMGHWAEPAVLHLYAIGAIRGYPKRKYLQAK